MLKEQLLTLAMNALSQAYEAKERIKETLKSDAVKNYVHSVKEAALVVIENRIREKGRGDDVREASSPVKKNRPPRAAKSKKSAANKSSEQKKAPSSAKKTRKSSIKPAKEIGSQNADSILANLRKSSARMVKADDTLNGKKSLAYLVWALGHAEKADIKTGISVHDVSALLYRSSKIELYPINISRVIHSNESLIKQVNQEKRTKTYLLSEEGQKVFQKTFMADL